MQQLTLEFEKQAIGILNAQQRPQLIAQAWNIECSATASTHCTSLEY
jgi:hypothetical protein